MTTRDGAAELLTEAIYTYAAGDFTQEQAAGCSSLACKRLEAAGYRVVPVWTLVDALADAIAECTNQGWDDPGSVTWRRAMAAGKKTLGVTIPGEVDTPS